MAFDNFSQVRLVTNKYEIDDAIFGMVRYIIEVYQDGNYEVEFSDQDGITIAQIVVQHDEIEPSTNNEKLITNNSTSC